MAAISTFKTYLMYKNAENWEKLCDISQFPDLGQDPNTIDVTTLSNSQEVFIQGIRRSDNLVFNAFYEKEVYKKIDALKGVEQDIAVWFGASGEEGAYEPDGSDGKFETKGFVAVRVTGGGVDEAVGMSITVTPTKEILMAE